MQTHKPFVAANAPAVCGDTTAGALSGEEERMAEYIERGEIFKTWKNIPMPASVTSLSAAIHQTPPADVALVVRAKWKFFKKQNKAVCTNCSFERDLDVDFGRAIACPNCGATMDA